MKDNDYKETLDQIPGVAALMKKMHPEIEEKEHYFLIEFLLWGLEAFKKLNKYRTLDGFQFKDSLGSYISRL